VSDTHPSGHVVDPSRVPDAPLREPFPQGGLFDVFRRRYLLRLLVNKEIQARYQGSLLGLMWSYIQPLTRFFLYFFVIGIILGGHKGTPNFAVYMFCGLVFVNYFTETFSSGTRSILRNKALVQKMAMPREMFPVSAMIVSAIHTFPQLVILMVAAVATGYDPSWETIVAFLLGLAILALFGTGLAILFSALNVYFRDFENVVSTLMIFTHWAVPLLYPWSKVAESSMPTWGKELYLANPLAEAVVLMQKAVWFPTCDDPKLVACQAANAFPDHLYLRGVVMVVAGIGFLAVCQRIFARLEGKFPERL
jgi:ABC-2 type transport system permease protein